MSAVDHVTDLPSAFSAALCITIICGNLSRHGSLNWEVFLSVPFYPSDHHEPGPPNVVRSHDLGSRLV